MKSLVYFYLGLFNTGGEKTLIAICNCRVPTMVFLEEYKKLSPIEEMPEKEKYEMKKYVISLFPNKTVQEKLDACKVIYCIGNLL